MLGSNLWEISLESEHEQLEKVTFQTAFIDAKCTLRTFDLSTKQTTKWICWSLHSHYVWRSRYALYCPLHQLTSLNWVYTTYSRVILILYIYIYTWQNDVKSFNSFRMHRVDFFCLLFPIGSCGFSAWGHHLGAAEEVPRQGGSSNSGSHAESCWVML